MTRAEVYAKIKEYGLQETIKNHYGYNYTNLSTATLLTEVRDFEIASLTDDEDVDYRLNDLIELLYKKHILCKSEYESLMD